MIYELYVWALSCVVYFRSLLCWKVNLHSSPDVFMDGCASIYPHNMMLPPSSLTSGIMLAGYCSFAQGVFFVLSDHRISFIKLSHLTAVWFKFIWSWSPPWPRSFLSSYSSLAQPTANSNKLFYTFILICASPQNDTVELYTVEFHGHNCVQSIQFTKGWLQPSSKLFSRSMKANRIQLTAIWSHNKVRYFLHTGLNTYCITVMLFI